jgi:hypothetical protein
MENRTVTKEIADRMMAIKGEVRGVTIKADWDVIFKRYGPEGIKKIENRMAELGYPLKYREIKEMGFYPIGLDGISISVIREVFNMDNIDLEELGAEGASFSFILKIFLKYFSSLSLVVEQVPKIWRKNYTVGDIEIVEFSEKEGRGIMRLKNFAVNEFFCLTIKGYARRTLSMVLNKPVICEETKCTFRGDDYHEFLFKW